LRRCFERQVTRKSSRAQVNPLAPDAPAGFYNRFAPEVPPASEARTTPWRGLQIKKRRSFKSYQLPSRSFKPSPLMMRQRWDALAMPDEPGF
jgi:hypothetical protein